MKVEESIYDKQSKTLRKGEWFDPTGFEHMVSECGKFATTADVLTLYAPLGGRSYGESLLDRREVEDYMLTYPCNYFERKEFRTVHGDGSIILWRSI